MLEWKKKKKMGDVLRCADQTNFVLSVMQMPKFTNVFQKPYHRSLYYIVYSAFSPCLARFRKRSKVCWCRSRDMKDEVILVDKISNLGAAPAPMPLSFLDEIQSATEKKWNMALVEGNWSKLNRKNIKKEWFFIIKKMSHLCLGLFFWCLNGDKRSYSAFSSKLRFRNLLFLKHFEFSFKLAIGNLKCVCSYIYIPWNRGRTSLTHALEGPH